MARDNISSKHRSSKKQCAFGGYVTASDREEVRPGRPQGNGTGIYLAIYMKRLSMINSTRERSARIQQGPLVYYADRDSKG